MLWPDNVSMTTIEAPYPVCEEIANSVTHGVGALLSIAGLGVMTAFATSRGDVWHVVACSIFGATMILLFTASTLYHALAHPTAKFVFQIIDHSAIYLLIAGTYTPFTLVTLRGPWGWSLFGVVWGIALFGIAFQFILIKRVRWLSTALYVALGWVIVIAMGPLVRNLPPNGLALLVGGGAAYTLGVVFYVWKKLPYSHAIWHGFVILGAALHFFCVLLYVIP
jgi:hemolysin III